MHLLATSSATLDDLVEPVDLRQEPADILILSFVDSDLAGLAAAWAAERDALPSVRLTHLRDLRHPMSVDLWIERVGARAKVILVRLLGGLDWWRYGVERLAALAREREIALAILPGEDRDDPRLAEASALPGEELAALLGYFREGGRENLRALLRRLAGHAGAPLDAPAPRPVPRAAAYLPGEGAVDLDRLLASLGCHPLPSGEKVTPTALPNPPAHAGEGVLRSATGAGGLSATEQGARSVIPVIFYRALLLADDTAPIDALCAALAERGLSPAPLMVASLKERDSAAFVRDALARLAPAAIVTTTAFAAGGAPGAATPLDGADVPVLQVVIANAKRAAWRDSPRGLGAADLAMHIVLPEIDGRVLAGAVAFKDPVSGDDRLAFAALSNRPEPDRVAIVADRIAALVRLQGTPRCARRVAVLMPDYPGQPGRAGYAVGLDVPASVLALLADLSEAGYTVADAPGSSRALIDALAGGSGEGAFPLDDYSRLLDGLPAEIGARIRAHWGEPAGDPDARDGVFRFRARWFGHILVALAPDRGRAADRRADYHDPTTPPRHALVAFGLWLQHVAQVKALVHMGAHGALEWLPGKAVALSSACFPEAVVGPLPVIYPFIVSNPGEAAQAKRRIAAVTIGHLPPPLAATSLTGDARELERLVDEYAQADGLDRRRRERLARLIIDTAQRAGLAREAGLGRAEDSVDALRRIDAWLCDLKDLAVKDGLHVFGRPSEAGLADDILRASVAAERSALLAALDGRRVAPGPAGSPARGRRDVLPTGRNLYAADPRTLPTPTAMDLGRLAADEVVRGYLQEHGEFPRALVVDLWGSATLRTGGEEIAQGLAFMGCQPLWDHATGRVTGVEVLPTAAMGRPRIDVTWRVSGLFRDLFPAQLALIDGAGRAVAARAESAAENPLAAARRAANGHGEKAALARVFGNAPGAYGSGVEPLLGRGHDRDAIGAAYLAAASHVYGGADGEGAFAPDAFAARVASADLLVHASDDPGRDLLEGAEDAAFVGGFAAAAAALGRAPDLVMLDLTDPERPRARPLAQALGRIVRARAVNPRFIDGQMRHGPRGAAEFAETVDRLVAFAETTDAVAGELFDLVYDAYLGDPRVRAFIERENPQAARAIAERLAFARERGFWHPRRNDVNVDFAAAGAAP